jgi:hypothetical protein
VISWVVLPDNFISQDKTAGILSLDCELRGRYLVWHQRCSPQLKRSQTQKGFPMKIRNKLIVLLNVTMLFASAALAQNLTSTIQNPGSTASTVPADTRIPRNSRVYIAPMNGFEIYLAAALHKKEVPLTMVTDRDLADFEITGTHETKDAGWAKTIFVSPQPSASASMQVVNLKTGVIVYADSSHRISANRGERSTAEKLAKYLKKKIEDDEK